MSGFHNFYSIIDWGKLLQTCYHHAILTNSYAARWNTKHITLNYLEQSLK